MVAAAGEPAARFRILPVAEGGCLKVAGACFAAWLESRGGDGPQETEAIRSQVRHFLEKNRARFRGKGDDGPRYGDVAGLIHTFENGDQAGITVFAVYPEIFRKDVCQGLHHRHVVEVLKQAGYLLANEVGRSDYKLRVSESKTGGFYAIGESILGVEADTEQGPALADDEVPF